jgi:type II secretory pathway component PulF
MALHINHQVMMLHHFKLTLKHEKNIEKAFIQVIPLLPKTFHKKLNKIANDIKQGYKIEDVIDHYKNIFHPFVVQTLSLLQNQLHFDIIIDHTIKHLTLVQKREEMKQKATRYPLILSIFIVFVLIGFVSFLLPFIKQMYMNFNVEPSLIIRIIDSIGLILMRYLIFILAIAILVFGLFFSLYFKLETRRKIYLFMLLKLQLLKRIQLAFYIRFFTYMQLMLLEKKPIFEVFVELEKRFQHSVFHKDLTILRLKLEEGQAISKILNTSPIFNHLISNLFQQAPSNEQIHDITSVLSQYYYEELMMRDQQFYALLEPILISILSVFVGVIAFMIYEPLLSIYEGL